MMEEDGRWRKIMEDVPECSIPFSYLSHLSHFTAFDLSISFPSRELIEAISPCRRPSPRASLHPCLSQLAAGPSQHPFHTNKMRSDVSWTCPGRVLDVSTLLFCILVFVKCSLFDHFWSFSCRLQTHWQLWKRSVQMSGVSGLSFRRVSSVISAMGKVGPP